MKPIPRHHSAFSLVEVTLALGVAAFALVAIFGLLPVGLNSNLASINQTAAASLATRIAADLKKAQAGGTSQFYQVPIPTTGTKTYTIYLAADGSLANSAGGNAIPALDPKYRATIVFTVPPAKTSYFGTVSTQATLGRSTYARILITWPALTDMTASKAPSNYSGSFETVIALDLN